MITANNLRGFIDELLFLHKGRDLKNIPVSVDEGISIEAPGHCFNLKVSEDFSDQAGRIIELEEENGDLEHEIDQYIDQVRDLKTKIRDQESKIKILESKLKKLQIL